MLLVWGVLVASVLGSVHCAAMCGAFACMASPMTGNHPDAASSEATRPVFWRLRSSAPYHIGRLTSYVILGFMAGALGNRIDRAGDLVGLSNVAAVVAGCLMVAWAAGTIAAHAGIRVPVTLAPEFARKVIGSALGAARDRSWAQRAYLIGLATTLLPCGWLYTFVVVAAGTGSATFGASVMLVFWIGTLPLLAAIVAGSARAFTPLMRRMPLATAIFVLVLGILSIVGKLRMPIAHEHRAASHVSSAHVVSR